MGPTMLLGRWGFHGLERHLSRLTVKSFDRWMANRLEPCDVFHCLSSFGLRSHRIAKEHYGALTVCDRGSSHIGFQDEILAEEYLRWGIPYQPIDRALVDRELKEYKECDLIFVPSTFVYRSFVQQGVPEAKLRKISYGVDLRMFRPMPKSDDVFRVIYVGALSLRKGIPYLLDALCGLPLAKFELWLIGAVQPEIKPFLAKYEGKFRCFGEIPRAELYRYYSQASVFVIASIEEGLALVQAQAMACGIPVIATHNTGAEDLFTDGVEGFIVPIRNTDAIRDCVLQLYHHPDQLLEMAKAALRRVQLLGGWDAYGQRVISCYQEAVMATV
jgi:glycosyltransferase involved in cell wall biosynthesis